MTRAVVAAVVALMVAGCGGDDNDGSAAPATTAGASTVVRQQIEKFTADFDREQARRLFAGVEEGLDWRDLVGRWQMDLNTTLGLVDVRAPDGGGPVMEIVKRQGDVVTLREQHGCTEAFKMRMQRSGGELRFVPHSGRCPETIDLLVEEPWRAQ